MALLQSNRPEEKLSGAQTGPKAVHGVESCKRTQQTGPPDPPHTRECINASLPPPDPPCNKHKITDAPLDPSVRRKTCFTEWIIQCLMDDEVPLLDFDV